jgi:hypothetical protein
VGFSTAVACASSAWTCCFVFNAHTPKTQQIAKISDDISTNSLLFKIAFIFISPCYFSSLSPSVDVNVFIRPHIFFTLRGTACGRIFFGFTTRQQKYPKT